MKEIEAVAREMFSVAHAAAAAEDQRIYAEPGWEVTWNNISGGYRAGWIAIANWHLSRMESGNDSRS